MAQCLGDGDPLTAKETGEEMSNESLEIEKTQETLCSSIHYSPLDGIQVHEVSTRSRYIYPACVQVKWL